MPIRRSWRHIAARAISFDELKHLLRGGQRGGGAQPKLVRKGSFKDVKGMEGREMARKSSYKDMGGMVRKASFKDVKKAHKRSESLDRSVLAEAGVLDLDL